MFTDKQKGIFLMVASALSLCIMQVAVRLSAGGIPIAQQIIFRNLAGLLMSFVLITKRKLSYFGPKKYQPALFGRSFFGLLGVVCVFYASARANQADVTILSKTSPFIVSILAAVFLKEKMSKAQLPALLIAFTGAFLVAGPTFESNFLPLFVSFLAAVFSGIAYTFLRFFKGRVDGITVIMHFSTFCLVAMLPFVLADFVMPTKKEWLALIAIGIFGSMGQICLTYAYQFAPAAEVSVYNYSAIIFSILLGYFILGESIPATSYLGGAMIIAAALLIYFYNKKHDPAAEPDAVDDQESILQSEQP